MVILDGNIYPFSNKQKYVKIILHVGTLYNSNLLHRNLFISTNITVTTFTICDSIKTLKSLPFIYKIKNFT